MAVIKLHIAVANIADVLPLYDQVKVYRATSATGTYTEITAAATRIRLKEGLSLYTFYDEAGTASSWYKTSYFDTRTTPNRESGLSDPILGDDSEELSYVMSVQRLKDVYLYGIDLTDDRGVAYPDVMFDFSIRYAIAWLERQLEIDIRSVTRVERYDYERRDYQNWMSLYLDHYPLIDVSSVKIIWPSSNEAITFPAEWITLQKASGQLNLVPTSGTLATALLTMGGVALPFLIGSYDYLPNAIEVTYRSGFEPGSLPYDLRHVIGMRASYPILNTAGDLIAGAGIANFSVSMDGVSQSIGTTSSATNSGYGARIIQYDREIKDQIKRLRAVYKGVRLAVA